ncbi:MAG TPA: DUF4149 domain-containing protein [Pyrinomonadaceae bacterium]|nr:DUF4149 domain-containing protein [Pyrinomonadaceae bacterium]
MKLLTIVKLFLPAFWLGAALFFSVAVAPAAFSVLRGFAVPNASEIAGTIVTRTLAIVSVSGFVVGLLVLLTTLAVRRHIAKRAFLVQCISAIVLAASTGVGHWIIAARMRALRVAMVLPIDQVAVDDPRRIAFNDLHGYSATALGIAMIAGLVAFLTVAYRTFGDKA